ncbi:MAG TPA: 6-bladed beta-propeller [Longimicrobium sp.]|uniref:6-bladed beta-propeller n=1 Tax=Longimicrobium sp. TaxID=2029185 RepID=UPI002EDA5439
MESRAPRQAGGNGWAVSPSPLREIGGADEGGAYHFTTVAGAVRLGDGRIVVADKGSQRLHVFDADGTHLRGIGREGGGPGEFRGLDGLVLLRGDSIAAWDSRLRRVSVLDPSGRLAREVTLDGLGLFPRFKGMLDDGSFVLAAGLRPGAAAPTGAAARRDSVTYLRFGPNGALLDTVGRFPGAEMVTLPSTGAMTMEQVVFGRDFHLVAGQDRFYAADDDHYEVTEYRPPNTPVRRIRKPHEEVRVSAGDLARVREQSRDVSGVPPQLRAQLARRNPDVPHRPTLPAFESLLLDAEGYLWVEYPRVTRAEASRWDVFDREGRWVTTVATPGGYQVLQVGRDFVLGTARDSLDVEHVRLYRLARSP